LPQKDALTHKKPLKHENSATLRAQPAPNDVHSNPAAPAQKAEQLHQFTSCKQLVNEQNDCWQLKWSNGRTRSAALPHCTVLLPLLH
jgi:hypothetical protein